MLPIPSRFCRIALVLLASVAVRLSYAAAPEAGPPYSVTLHSCHEFSVVDQISAKKSLSFWPMSEDVRRLSDSSHLRKVAASGYTTGVHVSTKDPALAAQSVLFQIGDATGLRFSCSVDSTLAEMRPATMVQGFSDTAVVTVVLTPLTGDEYLVSCAYVIDARPEGWLDGTPAGLAKMRSEKAEMARMLNDDSIAETLPASMTDDQIGSLPYTRQFFRGVMRSTDVREGKAVGIAVLMLKRKDTYTVGYYEQVGAGWIMRDKPVVMTGTRAPYVTTLHKPDRFALHGDKLDKTGSVIIYLEKGHLGRMEE